MSNLTLLILPIWFIAGFRTRPMVRSFRTGAVLRAERINTTKDLGNPKVAHKLDIAAGKKAVLCRYV